LASFIDLEADLEGPWSLRDLLLDRSKLSIPNPNTTINHWSQFLYHMRVRTAGLEAKNS